MSIETVTEIREVLVCITCRWQEPSQQAKDHGWKPRGDDSWTCDLCTSIEAHTGDSALSTAFEKIWEQVRT